MKLIGYSYSADEAARIIALLKAKGIPTHTAHANIGRMAYKLAIFVCLDRHYQDAKSLLLDSDHPVSDPVNIDEFEKVMESIGHGPILKEAFKILAVVLAVFAATLYFLWRVQ